MRADLDANELLAALTAAETMLAVLPETNTNWRGQRPPMTTKHALKLVRAALDNALAPTEPRHASEMVRHV